MGRPPGAGRRPPGVSLRLGRRSAALPLQRLPPSGGVGGPGPGADRSRRTPSRRAEAKREMRRRRRRVECSFPGGWGWKPRKGGRFREIYAIDGPIPSSEQERFWGLGMFSSGTCDLTSHFHSEFEWTEVIQKIPRAPALWVLAW